MVNDPYAALKVRDFRRFLGMRVCTTLAIQVLSVSISYFVYEWTSDAFMLGLSGLTEAVPSILISLYAGHLADKLNRKWILMSALSVFALCALGLTTLVYFRNELPKSVLLGGIYGFIFMTGVVRGFVSPASFSFLPQLVDRKSLSNAISWNSGSWEMSSVTGLGLGGLLYGFIGIVPTFTFVCVLLGLAVVFVWSIPARPTPVFDSVETAYQRILHGLKFVFSKPLIISTLALDLCAVLFGGAVAMLPVYAKDILHVGPEGMGLLRAAVSIGAIVTAFIMAHKPLEQNSGRILLWSIGFFGLCIIGFALSTHFWLSFVFLFLYGAFDGVSVFIRSNLVQHLTPDHMKGRVSSVSSVFITSSNEIGAFESGVAASLLGTVPSVIFGGCMTLAIVAFTAWISPTLRNLDMSKIND